MFLNHDLIAQSGLTTPQSPASPPGPLAPISTTDNRRLGLLQVDQYLSGIQVCALRAVQVEDHEVLHLALLVVELFDRLPELDFAVDLKRHR